MPAPSKTKYSYIPPAVQQTLNRQMQHNMPSHLQKYQNSGATMPYHAEKAMAQHLQKNAPKHLQQYTDAYVHQNIVMGGQQAPQQALRTPANPAESFKPVKTAVLLPNKENRTLNPQYSNNNFRSSSPPETPQSSAASTQSNLASAPQASYPPQQPSSQQDPYQFIMNSPPKPPPKPFLGGGLKARIMFVVGGFIVLLIIIMLIVSVLSRGDKVQTQRYLEIAQHQTELIRLSSIGEKKAKSISTRSYALTAKLSLQSSQKNFSTILDKHGINSKKQNKLLGATKNAKSDSTLDEAEKNNRFDETFIALMQSELANYQKELGAVSESATKSEQASLETAYNQAKLLSKGINQAASPESAALAPRSNDTSGNFITDESSQ